MKLDCGQSSSGHSPLGNPNSARRAATAAGCVVLSLSLSLLVSAASALSRARWREPPRVLPHRRLWGDLLETFETFFEKVCGDAAEACSSLVALRPATTVSIRVNSVVSSPIWTIDRAFWKATDTRTFALSIVLVQRPVSTKFFTLRSLDAAFATAERRRARVPVAGTRSPGPRAARVARCRARRGHAAERAQAPDVQKKRDSILVSLLIPS